MDVLKLRFKSDDGAEFPKWKNLSLNELFEYKNGKSNEDNVIDDGEFFLITLNSIDISGKLKQEHKRVAINDNSLIKNDLVMVLSDVAHGNFLGLTDVIPDNNYVLNQRMAGLRAKVNINVRYASLFINFSQKYFKLHGQGSSQLNLSKGDVLGFNLPIPCLTEQTKIADFLTAIDEKISQLTQKYELLNQYKKGVMQKIFSQKLRFKDDDGSEFNDWKDEFLGELCSIATGKLDANAMVENGEYRFYTCAKDYFRIDSYAFDTDALLISGNGANVGYIHHYNGKFNAYQRTYVLDKFKENILYIKYFLDAFLYIRIFKEAKEGNTPYIVMSTLTEMPIRIPELKEQTKIANFLTVIDDKITAAQSQLELVKQYKQGLLQQMFV
jgi:type I restriction enzyme S subunit